MKEKVYIETSIVSYLISKLNRDIVISAKQELTNEWGITKSKIKVCR